MRKLKKVLSILRIRILCARKQFVEQEAGEGFVDVMVKMLIVVVVGAALLAIMRTAIPNLFTSMIDKVKTIFEV